MNSHLTEDFITYLRRLPEDVKEKARKNYRLWRQDSNHPSLQFKRLHTRESIYSTRIGIGWRALGLQENNRIYWF